MALNTESSRGATQAFLGWLKDESTSPEIKAEANGLKIKPADIYRAMIEKHPILEKHYHKGVEHGLWVMFLESEWLCSIIKQFTEEEIPVLTIHDSVIVAESCKELAEDRIKNTPLSPEPTERELTPLEELERRQRLTAR